MKPPFDDYDYDWDRFPKEPEKGDFLAFWLIVLIGTTVVYLAGSLLVSP